MIPQAHPQEWFLKTEILRRRQGLSMVYQQPIQKKTIRGWLRFTYESKGNQQQINLSSKLTHCHRLEALSLTKPFSHVGIAFAIIKTAMMSN